MGKRFLGSFVAAVLFWLSGIAAPGRADDYAVDGMHAGIYFRIGHLGLSRIYGRFDDFSGNFTLDPDDPGKCSFTMTIKAQSIDTNNQKRDNHLRSPDFFNVKQFPTITFVSSGVKPSKDGYEVTGDLTMHGVTKPVSFALVGGKKAEFPPGVQRTGFSTELTLKRSDFGIEKFAEAVSDEVQIAISFEGTKK
jgi:polyisoprenoid-binding protein YceI